MNDFLTREPFSYQGTIILLPNHFLNSEPFSFLNFYLNFTKLYLPIHSRFLALSDSCGKKKIIIKPHTHTLAEGGGGQDYVISCVFTVAVVHSHTFTTLFVSMMNCILHLLSRSYRPFVSFCYASGSKRISFSLLVSSASLVVPLVIPQPGSSVGVMNVNGPRSVLCGTPHAIRSPSDLFTFT